jgi:hypothetical protein
MSLNAIDLRLILSQPPHYPSRVLGMLNLTLADGSEVARAVVFLQVNMPVQVQMLDEHGVPRVDAAGNPVMGWVEGTTWDTIQVAINENDKVIDRLNGPWLRVKFYTATDPGSDRRLHMFDDHYDFNAHVPVVAAAAARAAKLGVYILDRPDPSHIAYPLAYPVQPIPDAAGIKADAAAGGAAGGGGP